jgi:hypothetical protein
MFAYYPSKAPVAVEQNQNHHVQCFPKLISVCIVSDGSESKNRRLIAKYSAAIAIPSWTFRFP